MVFTISNYTPMMGIAPFPFSALLLFGLVLFGLESCCVEAQGANVLTGNGYYLDRFNYDVTVQRNDGFTDYGPEDWENIRCDEQSSLKSCLAYTDKWETGREWAINKNYCRSCPKDDPTLCDDKHHQSPINLERAVGYEPGTHELANECIVSKIYTTSSYELLMRKIQKFLTIFMASLKN